MGVGWEILWSHGTAQLLLRSLRGQTAIYKAGQAVSYPEALASLPDVLVRVLRSELIP